MAIVTTDNKHYKAIADKVREIKGTEETMTPSEMAQKVQEVYEKGQSEGGDTEQAFEDGKKAERNNFWEIFQVGGKRFSYDSAFFGLYDSSLHYGWNDETYNPIYPITLGNSDKVTKNYGQKVYYYNTEITDTKVDILVYVTELANTFVNAYNLKTIRKLKLMNEGIKFTGVFTKCNSLQNITFEGEKIANNISFADSPLLTAESVQSIIDALKDLTGLTKQTITFHKDVYISDTQKAKINSLNWSLSQI